MSRTLTTALLALVLSTGVASAQTKIKYALGDVIGIDDLPLLVAAERAKKRGVEVEITSFKNEDIATQAVINGQADVGQGTPYAALEKVNVPIRFFVQLWSLQFFPVVANEHYKGWKDLDGQEIAVQGRGSGTEAIMLLMAKEHGIKYKNISYVPGSQVRALAMLKGNIRATILDSTNKNFLLKEGGSKFTVLPLGNVKASDEALFARRDYLEKNQAAVTVFVEELVRVNREINKDPTSMQAARTAEGPAGQARRRDPDLLQGRRGGRHLPERRRRRERGEERPRVLRPVGLDQESEREDRGLLAPRAAEGRAGEAQVICVAGSSRPSPFSSGCGSSPAVGR
jgi:NitT/TauT family transport system substrate-binding protein